ncbi:hypothetical protein QTA56_12800 [Acinetobacter sp. VNH17]|uniref:Uncharacterized protein n=1 Tax=Acinetobacter thutiue TaxID=2998078 RepID=A0ABT7WR11_9GAMM|nr:hypothetical protein [Acinetobacter thutiue]MCY6412997.1 hypothetical protein [Acinetobacter thutiue]MDN0015105.1 hypothetical protein [Acinetobacter thutiue]
MIKITQEMLSAAQNEVARRNNYLHPHFNLGYLNEDTRQIIGFLGEFACQTYLGIDWRVNIRDNYLRPDDYDFIHNGGRVDVKTETLPSMQLVNAVTTRQIHDDKAYGRRLIVAGQYPLLTHYDMVMFGCFLRPQNSNQWNPVGQYWYPIGMIESQHILQHYQPTQYKPFGGYYPQACANIRTSELRDIA